MFIFIKIHEIVLSLCRFLFIGAGSPNFKCNDPVSFPCKEKRPLTATTTTPASFSGKRTRLSNAAASQVSFPDTDKRLSTSATVKVSLPVKGKRPQTCESDTESTSSAMDTYSGCEPVVSRIDMPENTQRVAPHMASAAHENFINTADVIACRCCGARREPSHADDGVGSSASGGVMAFESSSTSANAGMNLESESNDNVDTNEMLQVSLIRLS